MHVLSAIFEDLQSIADDVIMFLGDSTDFHSDSVYPILRRGYQYLPEGLQILPNRWAWARQTNDDLAGLRNHAVPV